MLLTDRINSCTSAIQRRRVAQENKQSAEAYTRALTQLNAVSDCLRSSLNCAATMKEKGIVSAPLILEQTRDDLLESANNCGQGVFDGTLSVETVNVLKAKSEAFSGQITIIWKDAASKYAEGIQGYLSMLGGLSSEPKKASEMYEKINKLVNGSPSAGAISKLVDTVVEAKKITDGFSLNEHIEAFLKKVSRREATVFDLSPEIMKWLKDKNLSKKLKIGF